jgi:16S rRNA (adenine(1408)-N(1))-methyltransferase
VDVGAGDGGYVLHRAQTEPTSFAIAIDASPDALASGAWRAKRARLVNAAFLVEGVERLPPQLSGLADEVTVHFPWGSLLRGLVEGSPDVVGRIADLLKPGAEIRVLLSAAARDGISEVTPSVMIARSAAYAAHGLDLVEAAWASPMVVRESHSAWAKRLGASRPVVFARYSRRSSRRGLMSDGTSAERHGIQPTRKRPS